MAADPGTEKSRSNSWAWPVGILIGLAIGIPSFGSAGGIAFGIATGIGLAIAFGAMKKPAEGRSGDGPEGNASGDDADGHRQG